MAEKKYSSGDVIFFEGDAGNSFFEIIEGTVGIYVNYNGVNQRMLTELGEGKYFGELAVIDSTPRSTTVIAVTDVTVNEIPEEKLYEFFENDPNRILEIMNHIGSRIRALTNEYADANSFYKEFIEIGSDQKSESFMSKLKKYIEIYSAAKKNLKTPSVEALRESSGKLSDSALYMETYPKGTIIFKEGETGKCMYAIHGGSVGIYSDFGTPSEKKLTQLVPGEFFGEMGMIAEEKRSATAVVEEDNTFVEIIKPDDLKELFESNPSEVDMILNHLSHRLRKLTDDYMAICKKIYDAYNK